ncbi:YveK family protein [Aerococcus kribbianus]|uniref:Capsular polysaccharide biosynthesis protein CpsC n=1 Tax=Aerococcus kribbianus TaxID=2999064 RepID=A0A9X3FMS5_9LACT|nr:MULTISPECIES: Wzz/FepE/Etk N-terminal domain-containing protein [unclassified Aerococcus]MCZ0717280.1 Wzz/FepE/Etk N-terminal domain-containing protein [Aerococcus sp. YH-aer221]MCZ0725568.1 Wzz/FepE/Etk N-terminal domain-containing protein [Aerococcus sp. YH-aer222]
MEETQEISLLDIYTIIKDKFGKILMATFIGFVIAALLTFLVIEPKYTATTDIVVNDTQDSSEQLNQSQLQTNLTLLNTYQNIVTKPVVLEPAIEEVGADMTVEELASQVTVTTESDSLIFSVTVENASPYLAADLANAIAKHFSNEVQNILNVQNVSIVTSAEPDEDPASPNVLLNLILGALIGGIIGLVYQLLRAIFDRTVRSSEIVEEVGWTMLGTLPEMTKSNVQETRFKKKNKDNQNRRRRV